MKRSAALTPLSHQHHRALFAALQLKRAEDQSASAALIEFVDGEGEDHFIAEETVLLPFWIAECPDADRAAAARVLGDHLEIRSAAARMRNGTATTLPELHELGELLERHVRFEERELFPAIESDLDPASLARLAAALKP